MGLGLRNVFFLKSRLSFLRCEEEEEEEEEGLFYLFTCLLGFWVCCGIGYMQCCVLIDSCPLRVIPGHVYLDS